MLAQPKSMRSLVVIAAIAVIPAIASETAEQKALTTAEVVTLPLSCADRTTEAGSVSRSPFVAPRAIRWKDREYDVDAAIPILMAVIEDHTTASSERTSALDRLGVLGPHVRGRPCLGTLVQFYPTLEKKEEQLALLKVLVISRDSRGIPLLYRTATSEEAPLARLFSAAGLARWNIRTGVRGLVEAFALDAPGPRGALGWGAVIAFDSENSRKGWGLPRDVADRADPSLLGLSDAALRKELQRRYRDWFEQNMDRFPDWKPGDPLPPNEPVPEDVAATKGWKCDQTCGSPADTDDCAACCVSHGACVTCCAVSFPRAKPAECRSRCELVFQTEKVPASDR